MSHLKQQFGDSDVHSVGMRYTFDDQGLQTGSYQIAGMGAEITSNPAADMGMKHDGFGIS